MRFSLRFLFIAFSVACLLIGWRLAIYVENQPKEVSVPHPINTEDYYLPPKTLIEYRNRELVKSHVEQIKLAESKRSRKRLAEVRKSPAKLSDWWIDDELIEFYPKEIDEITKVDFEKVTFDVAVACANMQWKLGNKNAIEIVKKRLLENREADRQHHDDLLEDCCFELEQQLRNDPAVLTLFSERKNESGFSVTAKEYLFEKGVDRQLYIDWHLSSLRESKRYDDLHVTWLLEHSPSMEVLAIAESRLRKHKYRLAESIMAVDRNAHPELKAELDRIESRILEFIDYDTDEKYEPHYEREFFEAFWQNAGPASAGYFRELLKDINRAHRWNSALLALDRIGLTEEAVDFLDPLVLKPNASRSLLDTHERICGPNASRIVCVMQVKQFSNLDALRLLAESAKDSRDQAVIDLVIANMYDSENVDLKIEGLRLLESIGGANLKNLWAKLPASSLGIAKFDQQWHLEAHSREEFVEWVNQNLKPKVPLTQSDVMKHEKYPPNSDECDLWRFAEPGIDSNHKFAIMALALSDSGTLFTSEWCHPEIVDHDVAEMVPEDSDEFKLQASDCVSRNGSSFRLVVNDRLYEFPPIAEDFGSDSRYDVKVAVEVANAIAIRQRLKKRFFVFENEWGLEMVLHTTPEIVRELSERFKLSLAAGGEFYLSH